MASNFTINVSPPPNRGVGGRADLTGSMFKDLKDEQDRRFSYAQEAYDRDAEGKKTLSDSEYKAKAKIAAEAACKAEAEKHEMAEKARKNLASMIDAIQEALQNEVDTADESEIKDFIALMSETNATVASTSLILSELAASVYSKAE